MVVLVDSRVKRHLEKPLSLRKRWLNLLGRDVEEELVKAHALRFLQSMGLAQ
jgi:hypothetical protein